MRSIKVMHLIHELGAGGAENGIINLVNHMDRDRFDSAICAFVGNGALGRRLDRKKTPLFELGKGRGNDLRLPVKLHKLFLRWKPDVVHTHAWGTLCEGLCAAKAARVPVVIHGEHGTMQRKWYNVLVQHLAWRLADRILSVSHDHARRLSTIIGFPMERISVLVNGVDTQRFSAQKDRSSIRARLNLDHGDLVIGTVGRLVPVKNQKLLISAFQGLTGKYPDMKLIIVGDGPLRGELVKIASQSGGTSKIRLLGKRSDVQDIMAAMDIFVLTSLSEGMSNTILEAMSTGLPVIATSVGGNPELVVDRTTGFIVPSDDVPALAHALECMVRNADLRQQMGCEGRRRVETHFSLQAMVRNYEQLYLKCVNEKARPSLSRIGGY